MPNIGSKGARSITARTGIAGEKSNGVAGGSFVAE